MPTVPGAGYNPAVAAQAPQAPQAQNQYRMMENNADNTTSDIAKAGQDIQGIGKEMWAADILNTEAASKLTAVKTQGAYDTINYDKDTGYQNTQGSDAALHYKTTVDAINQLHLQTLESLSENQQRILAPQLETMRNDALMQVNKHAAQQSIVAHTAATHLLGVQEGASAANALTSPAGVVGAIHSESSLPPAPNAAPQTAAPAPGTSEPAASLLGTATPSPAASDANATSPGALTPPTTGTPYENHVALALAQAQEYVRMTGVEPEARPEAIKEIMASNVYGPCMDKLLNGGSKGAVGSLDAASLELTKQYYAAIKDKLPIATQEKYEQELRAGSLKTTATDTTLDVQRQFPHNLAGQENEINARYKAGTLTADQRAAAVDMITADQARFRSEQAEQDKAVKGAVWKAAQDAQQNGKTLTYADLSPSTIAYAQSRGFGPELTAILNADPNRRSDPVARFNITTHFGDGSDLDVTKLNDSDLLSLRAKLSTADFDKLEQEIGNYRNGKPGGRDAPGSVSLPAFNAAVNSRLTSVGFDPKSAISEEDKMRLGAAQQFAHDYIVQDQQASGHRFNQDELDKSMDKLFATNVEFKRSLFGYQFNPVDRRMMSLGYGDIPSAAVEGITKDLAASGNPNPTHRDILMRYWSINAQRK